MRPRITQPIEFLLHEVLDTFPAAMSSLDYPKDQGGCWFLDLTYNRRIVSVQWFVLEGYLGVSLHRREVGYGEKPDWVGTNPYKALARVLHLLAFGDV